MPLERGRSGPATGPLHRDSIEAAPSGAASTFPAFGVIAAPQMTRLADPEIPPGGAEQAPTLAAIQPSLLHVSPHRSIIEGMDDADSVTRPDHERLFATATEQAGYFTTAQARDSGFSSPLITHHAQSGRFVRVARGLYRLRDYPSSPREELLAAWLRLAPSAVVSHESALELLGLSDIIPNLIHLSVPRSRRKLSRRAGVALHTTTRPFGGSDTLFRDGMRLTGPARTIVDVAEAGVAPEQVVRATAQAIDRGLTTPRRLREAARGRGRRVEQLVEVALAGTGR
jgi:predicted transcriptional regulator of viral defense system